MREATKAKVHIDFRALGKYFKNFTLKKIMFSGNIEKKHNEKLENGKHCARVMIITVQSTILN